MTRAFLDYLGINRFLISLLLVAVALATLILWPGLSQSISIVIMLGSICIATALIARTHWQAYMQDDCTLGRMTRNISLDIIGLLLTMAAASFAGGAAGQWAGMRAGLWAGLLEGFVVGFLAALVVRSAWGKLVGMLA